MVEGSCGEGAKKFGVSREEVCHSETLVKRLPADLVATDEAEQDPHAGRQLSLKALLGSAAA